VLITSFNVFLNITSCLNGKITVGHRFAIIANHYFPLSKALCVQDELELLKLKYFSFKNVTLFPLLITAGFWGYIYYSFEINSVHLKSIHLDRVTDPFGFWFGISFLVIFSLISLTLAFLGEEQS
jgi:hypothetical protein